MEQFKAFVIKEMYHIIRDPKTLLVLFGIPIAQIVLFGFALSNEVKNSKLYICNMSHDPLSTEWVQKLDASLYFDVIGEIDNPNQADNVLRAGKAHAIAVIPSTFDQDIMVKKQAHLQLLVDGSNPNLASTIQFYIQNITQDFVTSLYATEISPMRIEIHPRMLYNPQLKGAYTFVPGVMAMILMIICTLMTSVSIVREKELGSMEMLLVSPINPITAILSKVVPYLILSFILLLLILGMSTGLLGVPINGSLGLLLFICLVFIVASLSLGLMISNITNSQQVAMMISLMGLMLPTIMFGGFMFPIENMPLPLQLISNLVPAKWFYYSINAVMIKGLGIKDVLKEISILFVYIILFLSISIKKFNIRLV